MKSEEDFKKALIGKKVPLLVLDQKWHRLFAIHGKTDQIREIETQLDRYLAEQGQCNNDLEDLKKLKSSEILVNFTNIQIETIFIYRFYY